MSKVKGRSTPKTFYCVGFDLGGTKLAAALVKGDGTLVSLIKKSVLEAKVHPSPKEGQRRVIQSMIDCLLEFKAQYPSSFKASVFKGVGLASAGPLNVLSGKLIYPVNFPNWIKFNIVQELKKALEKNKIICKVAFQNDAVAAALAEGWIGHAKKLESYAVITIGTGIGTGVIFKNQPVQTMGQGSEFGHLLIRENRVRNPNEDLKYHTVEGLASGTGILRRAKDEMDFPLNRLEDLVQIIEDSKHSSKNSKDEKNYQILFDDAADALAALCYNLSIGFNLQKIFLSGGIIEVQHLFLNRMKKRYKELIMAMNPEFLAPIQIAKTKNMAGVMGAASLVK